MNKYGVVALKVVELIRIGEEKEPLTAWNIAASEMFGKGSSSQRKDCPRNAFLGLCEEGLVRGVPNGKYLLRPNNKNKAYAVEAVRLLKANPELAKDKKRLWSEVIKGDEKHNEQMDVVLALWNSGLIMGD